MHGLVNRTIQQFVSDTYGAERWSEVALAADLTFAEFEAMLVYEEALTRRVLEAVCTVLDKPRAEVLEDIGTYLVSHPNAEAVRRLLRFGGEDFVEFLHSLDDLPDRARLAVSDLELPQLELREHAADRFSLTVNARIDGFGQVMIGMLRSLADDYGALALLEHRGGQRGFEVVDITLIEAGFAQGRSFDLGATADRAAEATSASGALVAPGHGN
ncbi:heme NO-binding domain-containing protein [Marimonas arenosa]|uniref:Heme NO-binding domain-containing protein n=1 Tax=Marimonas arenosa TaxID=1795305 RepID=A0AAE3WGG3_9RHOB|nr:heme NO-binding domain-containing protein [Marimonas arenosa]MDQ2092262.1 heme NO-binding domain-containing protein [Marimonas arenosa]